MTFDNQSNLPDTTPISIGFFSGPGAVTPDITNIDTGKPIETIESSPTGSWYALSDLSKGVSVEKFSGRIYICYGEPWVPPAGSSGYEPGQTPADPNFYLRYDKLEFTFTGNPNDVADLTSIDYWAIPISIQAMKNGNPVAGECASGLKGDTTALDIYNALVALSTPPVSGLPGIPGTDGLPIPALVPGQFQQLGDGPEPGSNFARIIGPNSYPPLCPQGIPVQPYFTFQEYLTYLLNTFGPGTPVGGTVPGLGNGVIGNIAGNYAGTATGGSAPPDSGPTSQQAYDMTATIDGFLNITLSGTVGSGTGTMFYAKEDLLNPTGIYGGNANFYLEGAGYNTPQNDVYGWIGGDLFTGMNIGAVGNSQEVGGTQVGAMKSSDWYNLSASDLIAMQNGGNNFNPWFGTLLPLSDAYNFAYTDRLENIKVQVSLNPATVDTLQITLDDTTGVV